LVSSVITPDNFMGARRNGPRWWILCAAAIVRLVASCIVREFSCVPSARQLAWSAHEFTIFVHFGMNTFSAREWGEGTEHPLYFNPRRLDARQWVEAIRDAGTGSHRHLVDTLNPTGFGQVLAEYTGDGTGRQPVRTGFDPATHPTVNGQLGEITAQTFNYDAYGQMVGGNPTDTEYAFTGEEWDNDVGAYYLRARWYRPDWGRFLSRDTYDGDLEEPITQNRFLYGAANPVLYVDPSGHENAQTQVSATGIQGNLAALRQAGVTVVKRRGVRVLACIGAKRILTSGPIHYIFTNKSKSMESNLLSNLKKLFSQSEINLSDVLNKVIISGHAGPHPIQYHNEIR